MKRFSSLIACLLLFIGSVSAFAALTPSSPFRVEWNGGEQEIQAGKPFTLSLTIRVPEGHHLYADETDVDFASLEGLRIDDIRYPKAISYQDPFLGHTVSIFRGDVSIHIEGAVPAGLDPGEHELIAQLRFRGCSETLCYRPEEHDVPFLLEVMPPAGALEGNPRPRAQAPMADGSEEMGLRGLLHLRDFRALLDRGVIWTVLIVFLAGFLTSLTPCVWPILPAVLLFVGVHPHKRFWENALLALSLTSGLILVYTLLGMAAVIFGKNLGFLFQNRVFLALVVVFFICMSLAMFGAFDLRMPRRWQERMHRLGGEGYRGAFLAGLGIGLVASPCAGPVLAALLGYVAIGRSYSMGVALLIVYGMGMGVTFVILGAGYGELAGKLKGGPWMVWIRRGLGVLLLFPAAFYLGSFFGWGGGDLPTRAGGSHIEWFLQEEDALEQARKSGKPIMIDFRADWCPPCRALERDFFRRPEIVELSKQLVPLKIDGTVETDEVSEILDRYRVMGWPTFIFLDPKGRPMEGLCTTDYDPATLTECMRGAIERTK